MRITIEDLEALKELNDELEENHVETEKALQEEIGTISLQIYDGLIYFVQNRRMLPSANKLAKSRYWKKIARILTGRSISSAILSYSCKRTHSITCNNISVKRS